VSDFNDAETGIRQLQARYVDSVWRKDYGAFGDCFADDAEWRIAGRVIRGRDCCVAALREFMEGFDRVLMTVRTPVLKVDGRTAIGRANVTEEMVSKNAHRPSVSMAVYYDRFVQQGDTWRFDLHHYQLYYLGPPDMSGKFYEITDYGPPFAMPPADEPTAQL